MFKQEFISIKQYLNQKGIRFSENGEQLRTKCLFGNCDQNHDHHHGHLYFNASEGTYYCHKCGEKGNILKLAQFFGDEIKDIKNPLSSFQINKNFNPSQVISSEEVEKYHKNLPQKIREYLNNRGINNDIIDQFQIGFGSFYGNNHIVFPIKDHKGEFSYFKLRKDPYNNSSKSPKMLFSKGGKTSIYGVESLNNLTEVVLVEGECDRLVLEGLGIPTVTSTGGAKTFKKEWLQYFKHLKKIYICYDNDEAGQEGANRTAGVLSSIPELEIYFLDLQKEIGKGGDVTDYFTKLAKQDSEKYNINNFLALERKYIPEDTDDTDNADSNDGNDGKNSDSKQQAVMEILKLVENSNMIFFIDQNNELYVAINGDGSKIIKLDSKEFENRLMAMTLKSYGKVFSSEIIKNTIRILMIETLDTNKKYKLSVRVAYDKKNYWYDLKGKAVKINEHGWEVVDSTPILFKNFQNQKEQVLPERGGDLFELSKLINIKTYDDQILFWVYLVSCFIPNFPHPVIIIYGLHGSAKSTLIRFMKDLIDPSVISMLAPIKDSSQFIQTVSHNWASFFDNLSNLSIDLSDSICRVCTGGGFAKRKLYSDDDDICYNIQHVVGINGITNVVCKSDLLDRSILIELKRISQEDRKLDEEIKEKYETIKPKILGACFDAVSRAIAIKPNIKISKHLRMADFTKWGYAIAEVLGIGGERFLKAYNNNIKKQNTEAINANPIGVALVKLMEQEPNGKIEGEPAYILQRLNTIADEMELDHRYDKTWPKGANWLWKRLLEISPNLESYGIKMSQGRSNIRFITIINKNTHRPENEIEVINSEEL